ncbi:hypothetical protein BT63DRAFT_424346 [Microthyrium microscopicum]|uniref:Uncharacterized protein n=1 Tax=Microthyrium microscopicum TaxID=703497 RepID=A0A6A6UE12_9PEZI|nr:hypothetical protein BT63DRAFT_424346 [Microthyrium microscopicum]
MKFELAAALLSIASVQATAIPAAFPEPQLTAAALNVPRMITPKYRTTAKRAIIRYPAFTLAAKGVREQTILSKNPIN